MIVRKRTDVADRCNPIATPPGLSRISDAGQSYGNPSHRREDRRPSRHPEVDLIGSGFQVFGNLAGFGLHRFENFHGLLQGLNRFGCSFALWAASE